MVQVLLLQVCEHGVVNTPCSEGNNWATLGSATQVKSLQHQQLSNGKKHDVANRMVDFDAWEGRRLGAVCASKQATRCGGN